MKIERLIGILSVLLQEEKVTAPELAEKFEVSRRTINRDIEELCRAGIPICTVQGAGGGIRIMDRNTGGKRVQFLPEMYNWRTIAPMNRMFWKKHQGTSLEEARKMLAQFHTEVLKRIHRFSNEELFLSKAFPAVGGSTLGSYFVSSTSSHYDWAMKKIKGHRKNCI